MRDWTPIFGLPLWFWLFVLPALLCVLALISPAGMAKVVRPFWRPLDRIYALGGAIGACFLVTILVLIVAQMVARWAGLKFSGATEFAGYSMAAASFFSLAYALIHGAHIRVSIFLNMNAFLKVWLDAAAMFISAIIATYFARYAIKTNQFSVMLNDRTQGQDMTPEWALSIAKMFSTSPWNWADLWAKTTDTWVHTPIWFPQLAMSIGAVVLAVALWDYLLRLLITRQTQIISEGVE